MTNHKGFTIVELLISIAVIGILAAISIVAYNGVQQQAKDAKISKTVRDFVDAIKSHAALNDGEYLLPAAYGSVSPGTTVLSCLGSTTSYPASEDFSQGQCGPTSEIAPYDQILNDEFLNISDTEIAVPEEVVAASSSRSFRGLFYSISRFEETTHSRATYRVLVGYPVSSGIECKYGGEFNSAFIGGINSCIFTLAGTPMIVN